MPPARACVVSPTPWETIDLGSAPRLFLAAGGHFTGACERERGEKGDTGFRAARSLKNGEAALPRWSLILVLLWTWEGNAWVGGGKMAGKDKDY